MNRTDLSLRVRSLVRDLSNSFFRETDITNYLNEGIERVGQVIPDLGMMNPLTTAIQEVDYMPKPYQHLLAVYCSARLCTQDERHYQAGVFMNEFETKLQDLKTAIESGDVDIIDPLTGEPIDLWKEPEYVTNRYFANKNGVVPINGNPNRKKNSDDWGD